MNSLLPCIVAEDSNKESSLVFVDANGEQELSIEVVNPNEDLGKANKKEDIDTKGDREDIIKARELPTKTVGGLFYNNQEHLDTHRNVVRSKPALDNKIQELIATLSESIQTPGFDVLHPVGIEVRDLLCGAIKYANENSTSLRAAREMLQKALAIYEDACESAADKFELCDESTNALAEYKRMERERMERLIKSKKLAEAEAEREQGFKIIEQSIEAAKIDTGRVIARQRKEEQLQVLVKFNEEKLDIEKEGDSNLTELHMMSDNCESDISILDNGLETLQKSAEAALNRYKEKDHNLCSRLQENRSEQEQLRKRLTALQEQEEALEEERSKKKETQQRAEQTEERARDELQNWKRQIEELHRCCQAALSVMWQFKEGSFKLINSSIENKTNEERRLHELDILAHKTLRDGLVAASVDCKEVIKSSEESLAFIEEMRKENKKKLTEAARKGIGILENDLKAEKEKIKENYNHYKHKKAENEMKLQQYTKDIASTDERLTGLGEILESLDALYERRQKEVEAAWEQQDDDDDGGSFNSLEDS